MNVVWSPVASVVVDALLRASPVRPRPKGWVLQRMPSDHPDLPAGAWNVWTCILQGRDGDAAAGQGYTPEAAISTALSDWAHGKGGGLDALRRFRRRLTN